MSNLKGVKKPFIRKMSKRATVVMFAGLIVAVSLLVTLWLSAASAWQSQAESAIRDQQSATKARQKALNADEMEERQAAITELTGIKYVSERCNGGWWYAWQQNVSEPAKTAKMRCEAANRSLGVINKALMGLKRYLQDEKMIETQLAGLKMDPKQKDWQVMALNSANKAPDTLKAAKVSQTAEPVVKEAVKRIESISSAWKTLNEADKKQDKAAYLAAMTALGDSYAGLSAVSDASDAQVLTLVNDLENAE